MTKPVIALDIETTGLDPWRDEILMVGLWNGSEYRCIRAPEELQTALNYVYHDWEIVGHRTDFDLKHILVKGWISKADLEGRTIHDTRIIGSLLRQRVPKAFLDQYEIQRRELNKTLPKGISHREGSPLSLKTMAPWYLKIPPFWENPAQHDDEEYNQRDCMYTYRLYQLLAPRLQAEGSWDFYMEKMLPWQQMLMEMEIKGISIDLEELDRVEVEFSEKRDLLKQKLNYQWTAYHAAYLKVQRDNIYNRYYEMREKALLKAKDKNKCVDRYNQLCLKAFDQIEPFNYASSQQMAWLLKEQLGLNIEDLDGEESTGKAVLHRLAAEGREDIKTFLDWREADKVLTMYVPTYRNLEVDGVIHPNFNLTGTRTGRTSSSGPNLQQVPPKLYRLFRPRPGHRFIQYDLSAIEAALIALYSGDKRLYEILEKGESIHDHNAVAMFGLACPVAAVGELFPRERKTVKNIGFACFYGAGWRRISKVFAAGGFPISDQDAKAKLALLKSYYPQVFAFHKEVTEIFEAGETVFNLLGRPITIQPHENPYMQGFNTLIQSSASDLNLEACYRYKDAAAQGGRGQPLLVIHDCIISEAFTEQAGNSSSLLQDRMTDWKLQSVNGPIQLRVEGGVSERWEK